MSVSPYSNNIIFFDTEFTDLDIRVGELLSIGLIKYNGEELYLELQATGPIHPWVQEKVIPHLNGRFVSREVAQKQIREFFGDAKPYLLSYVNQFDAVYWYELFGSVKDHPAFWIPIDFASILFGVGLDPNSMGKKQFFDTLEINKENYKLHNALDDARLLRDVYRKLVTL